MFNLEVFLLGLCLLGYLSLGLVIWKQFKTIEGLANRLIAKDLKDLKFFSADSKTPSAEKKTEKNKPEKYVHPILGAFH